jgi:hypothetical protein
LKLSQLHKNAFVIFELTDTCLKITSYRLFKKETREILYEDIIVKDLYELEYRNRYVLSYLYVCVFLFGYFAFYYFLNPRMGWITPLIFGILMLICIIRFFIRRMKIYIPAKDQAVISFFKEQPGKKTVEEFIHILEGKADIARRKGPKEDPINDFITHYFPKNK